MERVEGTPAARVRIAPALTRDFVGSLRRQVNAAVTQAQRGLKPIQIRAVLSDTSRAAIAREIRTGAQTVRAATPVPAGAPAVGAGTAVRSTRDLAAASLGLINVEKLLAQAARERIPLLGALSAEESALARVREQGARSSLASGKAMAAETQSAHTLAAAKAELAAAEQLTIGSSQRAQAIRRADRLAVDAFVQAQREGSLVGQQAATAFRNQIRTLEGATGALNETSRAARQAASNMSQLRRGVLSTSLSFLGIRGATLAASARFLAGAAAIVVFAKALQSATAFATQMNVFRATASATGEEMERVADAARALGADITLPGVTAADAGESMVELAKAGLGVQDAIDGARGVLQLATAAAIENAQAVELAANALNAFELAGRDAVRVADVFANAANAAQGSIVDIGIAFQQASAAGRQVGLTFEDTSTFLTILARNGLRGSDAGTSLRTALIRLIKPTKEARDELARLGVETRDAAGNLRPDIFIQIADATRQMTPAARDATIALIGGQDAFRAISILGRQSIGSFIALRKELRTQGTAAELAAARTQGFQGALDALSNTLSTVGLRAGKALTPALQGIVEGLTGFVAGLAASSQAAGIFGGFVENMEIQLSILGTTLEAVGALALPVAGALASITNAIGIPTIIAAVVAYKLLPAVFLRIRATATVATVAMSLLALQGVNPVRAALTAAAASFNVYAIAATVAAAAIFFMVTRESAAARSARQLKEATDELITSQEALNQARQTGRDAPLQVNAAQLAVFDARARAAQARAALRASDAPEESPARLRIVTELAVAIDNVSIAQNALNDALERARAAEVELEQARRNQADALTEETKRIQEQVVAAQRAFSLTLASTADTTTPAAFEELAAIGLLNQELRKRAQELREQGDAESIALAERLELIIRIGAELKQLPSDQAIEIAVEAPNLKAATRAIIREFGITGKAASQELFRDLSGESARQGGFILTDMIDRIERLFVPQMGDIGTFGGDAFGRGVANGIRARQAEAEAAANALVQGIMSSLTGLEGQAKGLTVQENLAVIASGATGARLPALQEQLANARQREAEARAGIARIGETHNLRTKLRKAIEDQARFTSEIRGINSQLASEAQAAADQATEDQNKRFSALLEAMGVRRDPRQQALENAQLTEGAADDLAATRKLRQLAKRQIDTLRVRIAAAIAEGKNVKVLTDGLAALRDLWRDLGREVIALQKTKAEERQARIAESISLDIEFAQLTENRNAEIRARLREIARLKKLQSAVKNDIVERKRLRNLIAEQEKAIEELRKQNDDRNKAFQELSFSFLTTQQGFAANLLGNLLPQGSFGGTVGENLATRGGLGGGGGGGGGGAGGGGFGGAGGGINLGAAASFGGGLGAAEIAAQTGMGLDIGLDLGGAGGAGGVAGAAAAAEAGTIAPPTRGQVSTTNDLLRHILRALRHQNERTKHPSSKKSEKKNVAIPHGIGGV